IVLRASDPKRSAISSCAGPKTRRKSLARNLPNLLAAIAAIVFTDRLQDRKMVSFSQETGRRKTSVNTPKPQRLTEPPTLLSRPKNCLKRTDAAMRDFGNGTSETC